MSDSYLKMRTAPGVWTVRAGGSVIAESRTAVELTEGARAPVIYFPRGDIAMALLDRSDRTSHCPHKGEARYFSVVTQSVTLRDVAWSYENPLPGAERIAGHIAFHASADVLVEQI